jgi:predicted DNA-binding transcriptional regulator AlpA
MDTAHNRSRYTAERAPASRHHLRSPAAAAYLGLSTSTLAKMRLRGDGPPFARSGRRIVVYDVADLEAWLGGRKRHSTSETGGAR